MKVKVDEKKFAFIMCTNNKQYCREALHYIEKLTVPDGYIVEMCVIEDAAWHERGIPAGAMMSSQAKYKIYLHRMS